MSFRIARPRAARLAPLCLLLVAGVGAGCHSGARGEGGPTPPASRSAGGSAAADYEAGLYASAYAKATREAESTSGNRRERSALIAGMAAHALDRNEDAERWVGPLTASADREISGRAMATLGLIEQERGRHARAAQLLNDAASRLSGDEATRARAAAAHSARSSATGAHASAAGSPPPSGGARGTLGPYSLQLGAFSSKVNADKMAEASAASARRAGMGGPEVSVDRDSKGRSLWVVRVGAFPSRAAAMRGQRTFSKAIVVQTRAN